MTLAGVHWTWPTSDPNPAHYVVVPTTVNQRPVLVWAHLPSTDPAGTSGLAKDETQWTGPATLWLTPWRTTGGSLATDVQQVLTIPAIWSHSGRVTFPGNPTNPQSNPADSAWTGWVSPGWTTTPPAVAEHTPIVTLGPTVATTVTLYAADQGVVVTVGTHLVGANQGAAANLYYCNPAHHQVDGLASLTTGEGMNLSVLIVSGLVLTQQIVLNQASSYVFNEATGKARALPAVSNHLWTIQGARIEDAGTHQLLAQLPIPEAVLEGPPASAFVQ